MGKGDDSQVFYDIHATCAGYFVHPPSQIEDYLGSFTLVDNFPAAAIGFLYRALESGFQSALPMVIESSLHSISERLRKPLP